MDRVKLEEAHVVPADGSHKAEPFCWCQPVCKDVLPNGRIYLHRRYLDGPVYERDYSDVSVPSSGS